MIRRIAALAAALLTIGIIAVPAASAAPARPAAPSCGSDTYYVFTPIANHYGHNASGSPYNLYFNSASGDPYCSTVNGNSYGDEIYNQHDGYCLALDAKEMTIFGDTSCGNNTWDAWQFNPVLGTNEYLIETEYSDHACIEETSGVATFAACSPRNLDEQFEFAASQ